MNDKVPEDFYTLSMGLVKLVVCSNMDVEATTKRVNMEYPTGIRSKWALSEETFADNDPNPTPCDTYPETHKHYLFNC